MSENTIQRIKKYLDAKGLKISTLEKEAGMSNGSFASQLKNNKTIGIDKLENILKKYTDINLEWLLTGNGSMLKMNTFTKKDISFTGNTEENSAIPLYNISTVAGIKDLFDKNKNQTPLEYITIPKITDSDGALQITGDAMSPLVRNGDILVYKKINNPEKNIIWGEMYLIYINNDDNEFFFTRYIKHSEYDSHIKLVAFNSDHEPIEFPFSSIKALALVKASVRINSQF